MTTHNDMPKEERPVLIAVFKPASKVDQVPALLALGGKFGPFEHISGALKRRPSSPTGIKANHHPISYSALWTPSCGR